MAEFIFLMQSKQVIALRKDEIEQKKSLIKQGFILQFEQVEAISCEKALVRFACLRKEERTIEHAFISGSLFSQMICVLLR